MVIYETSPYTALQNHFETAYHVNFLMQVTIKQVIQTQGQPYFFVICCNIIELKLLSSTPMMLNTKVFHILAMELWSGNF